MGSLSVAVAVEGLLQITANVIGFLLDAHDAPTVARDLLSEVQAMQLIFEQLRRFVHRFADHDRQRVSRIDVDGLVAVLTGCVCTFSEIDGLLENCNAGDREVSQLNLWDRAKWAAKTGDITRLVGKLQCYKSSLTLLFAMLVDQLGPSAR